MDGRKNNHGQTGEKNGGGNPGYGKSRLVIENFNKFAPIWWEKLGEMLNGGEKDEIRFAMQEFNKVQVKMIPTDLESGGQPLVIRFDPTFHAITSETTNNSE